MMFLTQETGTIQPVGIVLIVGFVIILILCVRHDKKKSKQLGEETDKKFDGKIADGDSENFITTDRELVMRFAYGITSGYNVFKLNAIAYVMTAWDLTSRQWVFALYDENKKCIQGQQFISTKKNPVNTKAYVFTKTKEESIDMWELIHSHVPNAKHVGLGFKEIEE